MIGGKANSKNRPIVSGRKLRSKYQQSLLLVAKELEIEATKALSDKNYWSGFEGRLTRRKNGDIVIGARRNIIDRGGLIDSQKLVVTKKENGTVYSTELRYSAPHYRFVRLGTKDIPGRDWVKLAQNRALRGNSLGNRIRYFANLKA